MRKTSTISKIALSLMLLGAGTMVASAEGTIEIGKKYTGLSASNPLEAFFTAESNGTLKVMQNGTFDSRLYESEGNYSESNSLISKGYTQNLNIYTLPYVLAKGQTVYYYSGSDVTSVEFSWEPNEQGLGVINEGTPFQAYETVMEYTPKTDGMLTITAETYYQFNWASPAGTGLLFSDLGLQNKVELQYVGSEADMDKSPTKYTTPVTGGTTYYFYNSAVNCSFTFTLSELTGVTLVDVVPTPGMAFDYEGDYGAGVILTFDPAQVEFTKASITYTPAGSKTPQIIILENEEGAIGENAAYEYKAGQWTFQAVPLYFAKSEKGTDLTLTLENVNYNGIELVASALNNTAVVVKDGNVSVTWTRPAVDMSIVSESWPQTVYSNSANGDSALIATITFNENIISKPSASMVFGSQVWGSGSAGDNPDPGMDLPCSVTGATITVDMSGINFGSLYSTGSKTYNEITVFIGNIIGADGQKFNQKNPGIAKVIPYNNNATSGVNSLESEAAETPVYNLEGVKVGNSLEGLSKGIYVVNGKKVVVK